VSPPHGTDEPRVREVTRDEAGDRSSQLLRGQALLDGRPDLGPLCITRPTPGEGCSHCPPPSPRRQERRLLGQWSPLLLVQAPDEVDHVDRLSRLGKDMAVELTPGPRDGGRRGRRCRLPRWSISRDRLVGRWLGVVPAGWGRPAVTPTTRREEPDGLCHHLGGEAPLSVSGGIVPGAQAPLDLDADALEAVRLGDLR
jgi:hypothetical protein